MGGKGLRGLWMVGGEWMSGMEAPAQREDGGHLEASRWMEATLDDAIWVEPLKCRRGPASGGPADPQKSLSAGRLLG